jgi:hypothetical protein
MTGVQLRVEKSCPLPKTHNRLRQTHDLWHEMEHAYTDADEFVLKLNACLTAARSVTFVLKKELSKRPWFEDWYAGWENRMREDARMRWLVQARNTVEKQGDLDTASVALVSVLLTDGEHPVSRTEVPPLAGPAQIAEAVKLASLPERLREQAVLCVERRWTVPELADQELLDTLAHCYPLAIFHGDVGTGKTASAEAASDALARMLDVEGHLLKLSTRVRGIGHVGEMSTLIGDAFDEALALAGTSRFVTLLVDEGDALAFNRAAERAHHEDRVGVNTMIQKIDDARRLRGRLLIILCTNRFVALDPAVIRRAALIETFERPSEEERRELLAATLTGVALETEEIDALVAATGEHDGRPAFTFSDIQTRLISAALAHAYPERGLRATDLLAAAAELEPSPRMADA